MFWRSPWSIQERNPTAPFSLCQIWGLSFLRFSEVGAGADMWKIHPVVCCGHAFNTCIHCTWTSIMFWHYEGIIAFCLGFILTIKENENCFVFPGYGYFLQNIISPDAQAWTLNLSIISKLSGCKGICSEVGMCRWGRDVGIGGGVTMSHEKWSVPSHTWQHRSHLFFADKPPTGGPFLWNNSISCLFMKCTRYWNMKRRSPTRSLVTPPLAT